MPRPEPKRIIQSRIGGFDFLAASVHRRTIEIVMLPVDGLRDAGILGTGKDALVLRHVLIFVLIICKFVSAFDAVAFAFKNDERGVSFNVIRVCFHGVPSFCCGVPSLCCGVSLDGMTCLDRSRSVSFDQDLNLQDKISSLSSSDA